ncbi:MAG: Riboflavin biosynthesis protein RibD [Chlamydiae bacterium]|nr:Riboflavin biosynthesis protein RibD [Chlamydiota bacterium]
MQETKEQQQFFMRLAIALGEKGRTTAPPNPWVGCLIVRDGESVGEGYHKAPGEPHAELVALEQAGILARGATAYITLEPCAHFGRTAPCVSALIQAGIGRVMIPFLDPDPQVSGKGVHALEEAGISVVVGVAVEDAKRSLEPYLYHRKTGRPFCVLKTAMSLDGRTAAADGSSQWITGEEARADVHHLRAESQAILIGSKTAQIDRPKLNVRGLDHPHQPLRVILDSEGKVSPPQPEPTVIFTTQKCSSKRIEEWKKAHIEVEMLSQEINLEEVLDSLGRRGIIQLLVEGGPTVHGAFLKKKLCQRLVVYVGGCLLGPAGKSLFPWPSSSSIEEAYPITLESISRFGNDARLSYRL